MHWTLLIFCYQYKGVLVGITYAECRYFGTGCHPRVEVGYFHEGHLPKHIAFLHSGDFASKRLCSVGFEGFGRKAHDMPRILVIEPHEPGCHHNSFPRKRQGSVHVEH